MTNSYLNKRLGRHIQSTKDSRLTMLINVNLLSSTLIQLEIIIIFYYKHRLIITEQNHGGYFSYRFENQNWSCSVLTGKKVVYVALQLEK